MFREMRRIKQEISEAECKRILREEKRGVLSVIGDDGYPYGIPLDFYYDEEANRIHIHCAKVGHKIDAIKNCDKVSFTVWNQGYIEEGHWEYNVTSVILFGRAELVCDRAVTEKWVRKLAQKYYPPTEDIEAEVRSAIDRVQLLTVNIEHMTGKLVNEK